MLQITPDKVAHVIIRARELEAKVAPWQGAGAGEGADGAAILQARRGDATEAELRDFIAGLNEDEQASLVALMWIGRETYDADELAEALQTARAEATTPTEDYLLGVPLLADYLEEGLEALGINADAAEDDLL